MKRLSFVLPFVFVPILAACTTGQLYESLENAARDKCNGLAEPDRSACLGRNRDSYDSYKKKRDEATGGTGRN